MQVDSNIEHEPAFGVLAADHQPAFGVHAEEAQTPEPMNAFRSSFYDQDESEEEDVH
jgi:hypothetical protein